MSKRMLSKRSGSISKMIETLEERRLMSVSSITIPNATVNDSVYDLDSHVLHVVYFDTSSRTLKYQALGNNGAPVNNATATIDANPDVGQYLSLAIDDDGALHAAYYDATNGDLKYARRDLAGIWSTQTIHAKNTVGLYPSIAIGTDNRPAISYYNKTGGNLNFARFNGTSWVLGTVEAVNDVGRYSGIALNPVSGKFGIGYENTTNGNFHFAEVSDGVLNPIIATVDSTTTKGGGYVSLAYNGANPAMSYYDAANADLKYAERVNGVWNAITVAANTSQGMYTDLAFTFDTNQPAIVYYHKTADRVNLAYRTPNLNWVMQTQATGGGRNVSVADGDPDNTGAPDLHLVYTDSATGHLKIGTF